MSRTRTLEPAIIATLKQHGKQTIYSISRIMLPDAVSKDCSSQLRRAVVKLAREGKINAETQPRGMFSTRVMYSYKEIV